MKKKIERKSNSRKSVLLLLLLTVFLVVSSYAWFTSNQTVSVATLDVKVEAKNGLQISTDGANWKSVIQKTDITSVNYTGNRNQLPPTLEPVSTGGIVDTSKGTLRMFYGLVEDNILGDYILTSTREEETRGITGKFIAFDLYFQVNEDTDVYLGENAMVSFIGASSKGMENAARVAFVYEGNQAPGVGTAATAQAFAGATDSTVYIWEPNFDVHSPAAVTHANTTYGITTQLAGATALTIDGLNDVITAAEDVEVGDANTSHTTSTIAAKFETVIPAYKTAANYNSASVLQNIHLFELKAGITKFKIYMWVEGQDVDCENNASGTDIAFDLEITINEDR